MPSQGKSQASEMAVLDENCIYITYGVSALFAIILLRLIGGKNRSVGSYVFGVWHFVSLVVHLSLNLVMLLQYTNVLKESDFKTKEVHGPLLRSVKSLMTQHAQADLRMASPEYKNMMVSISFALTFVAGSFSLITFLGYLFCKKLAKAGQLVTASVQMAVIYAFLAPEYFSGFRNIKNWNFIYFLYGPWVVIAPLAFLCAFAMITCGDGASCAASCKTDQQKKKKQ